MGIKQQISNDKPAVLDIIIGIHLFAFVFVSSTNGNFSDE
jgi:hypothetical protein